MRVDVFLSVVVRKLFSRLYVPLCVDEDAPALYLRRAIGTARVVDVAGGIPARHTIDRFPTVHCKEIFTAARVRLGICYRPTEVLDDALAFFEGTCRKKPESGA